VENGDVERREMHWTELSDWNPDLAAEVEAGKAWEAEQAEQDEVEAEADADQ
jgi:hypothetical protein